MKLGLFTPKAQEAALDAQRPLRAGCEAYVIHRGAFKAGETVTA